MRVEWGVDLTKRYVRDLSSGEVREAVERDYWTATAELLFPGTVHPLVSRAYHRAVRLLRYSWFEADFSEVAELESLRALEFYLVERYRTLRGEPERPGLGWILKRAVDVGWLVDSPGLREGRFGRLAGLDFLESLGPDWDESEVFGRTIDWLREYRNELAHGSQMHLPGGFVTLRLVREIIVQVSAHPERHR